MNNINILRIVLNALESLITDNPAYKTYREDMFNELVQNGPSTFDDVYTAGLLDLLTEEGYGDLIQHMYDRIESFLAEETQLMKLADHSTKTNRTIN